MQLKTLFPHIDHFDACKRKRKQINKQSTILEMFGKKKRAQTDHPLDKDGQNYISCHTFSFFTCHDVICDLLQYRRTQK